MTAAQLLYPALFLLAVEALLLLPFAPALREWRRPTDRAPLPIPDDDADDPMYLPERLRARIAAARPGERPEDASGHPSTLFAKVDLELDDGAAFAVVMTEGRLHLGPRSRICNWGHADAAVRLAEGSIAARRLSSRELVRLERDCCFQRVHAPAVCFGAAESRTRTGDAALLPAELAELPFAVQRARGVWWIDGDCSVPPGRSYTGDLIVTGRLSVGTDSRIHGSVKAHEGIVVGRRAGITGAAVSPGAIHVLPDAAIGGPLVSETYVLLSTGTCVGTEEAPTTVSAEGIVAEEGARAHGTVWARRAGVVLAVRS